MSIEFKPKDPDPWMSWDFRNSQGVIFEIWRIDVPSTHPLYQAADRFAVFASPAGLKEAKKRRAQGLDGRWLLTPEEIYETDMGACYAILCAIESGDF